MKMPGLALGNNGYRQFGNGGSANGFWSKHRDVVSYNQLQKFWSELSPQARQELLRVDKQTLFEQARKTMYCSRCNGLLLEGFLQIVTYGKSLQQEGLSGLLPCNGRGTLENQNDDDLGMTTASEDDVQDPSVHPWSGLTTNRDGALTLLDCYLHSKSLKELQNVFDAARVRERERAVLYPDACGGGGRGWMSQGMTGYGRGHGMRETCALHTARLSVDTLVDFWSALGEETRQSLLRMKEEDFIERLMYRFDSKRFCRDCRRNVIREFKELKELKRMRRETRCTNWFCIADTTIQYEVSHDTVQADWHETLMDNVGTYHHVEWAVGTGEGKSDILEFENVGMKGRVQESGLDLGGLNECWITLRAWKLDGRCSELSVKAHALKGQQCVHSRLVVGDGFVTMTRGESIRRFFEHAEEAEEEEDDDTMDKDGNELDGEFSRPQKHAKSPELAREFLLDAATVIFKEQVEKAFREGTARQNAHSIFVGLALKLLEERVHVAFKEIVTLEKQMKLVEEEEKEKREEEERKERRRTKEREKKLRRKERLRIKEKDKESKSFGSHQSSIVSDVLNVLSLSAEEQLDEMNEESICKTGDSPSKTDAELLSESIFSKMEKHSDDCSDCDFSNVQDGSSFAFGHSEVSSQNLKFHKESQSHPKLKRLDEQRWAVVAKSRGIVSDFEPRYHYDNSDLTSNTVNGMNKHSRSNSTKLNVRNGGLKFGGRLQIANDQMSDRFDLNACSCNQNNNYRVKAHTSTTRLGQETKSVSKPESVSDVSKPYYCSKFKDNEMEYARENCGRPKSRIINGNNPFTRDSHYVKKVWEPMESLRKHPQSNSVNEVTLRSSTSEVKDSESGNLKSSGSDCFSKVAKISDDTSNNGSALSGSRYPCSTTSSSDNCSSYLSEGDSITSFSNSRNTESSSSSDSEDSTPHSEGGENLVHLPEKLPVCPEAEMEGKPIGKEAEAFRSGTSTANLPDAAKSTFSTNFQPNAPPNLEIGRANVHVGSHHPGVLPPMHNPFPMFQGPSAMAYHRQSPVTWPAAPANGLIPFPPSNHYVCARPFGYGLKGNSPFMKCAALQNTTTSTMLNPRAPFFKPLSKANGLNAKDQAIIPKPRGVQESFGEPKEGSLLRSDGGGQNGSFEKLQGNPGFSLFHSGGPVALPTEYKSDPAPDKDHITSVNLSSKYSADPVVDDSACNKRDIIEEYNLFAASNQLRFSFF